MESSWVSLVVSVVIVVFAVVSSRGQAAELPNYLKEDTISKNLFDPSAHSSPRIVSAAAVAASKNAIVSVPSVTNVPSLPAEYTAIAKESNDTVSQGESLGVPATFPKKESDIPVSGPEPRVEDNDNEQQEANLKLLKLNEKSTSIIARPAEKKANNEHDERIGKVTPVKENTVATHAVKGGSSSSLKVAAQMVGVYQHNKR